MQVILSQKVIDLYNAYRPWTNGSELKDGKIEPVFKDDTPDEIKAKYDEFVRLSKEELDGVL